MFTLLRVAETKQSTNRSDRESGEKIGTFSSSIIISSQRPQIHTFSHLMCDLKGDIITIFLSAHLLARTFIRLVIRHLHLLFPSDAHDLFAVGVPQLLKHYSQQRHRATAVLSSLVKKWDVLLAITSHACRYKCRICNKLGKKGCVCGLKGFQTFLEVICVNSMHSSLFHGYSSMHLPFSHRCTNRLL